jgi:hypothetical protein
MGCRRRAKYDRAVERIEELTMLDPDQIDLRALAQALQDHSDEHEWWLDPSTGEIVFWSELVGDELDDDHPDVRADWHAFSDARMARRGADWLVAAHPDPAPTAALSGRARLASEVARDLRDLFGEPYERCGCSGPRHAGTRTRNRTSTSSSS